MEDEKLMETVKFHSKDEIPLQEVVRFVKEKTYLFIYKYYDTEIDEFINTWEIFESREAIFDFIKGCIDDIDIFNSKVLTTEVPYKNAYNVYKFMKLVGDKYFPADPFNIDDYVTEEEIENMIRKEQEEMEGN